MEIPYVWYDMGMDDVRMPQLTESAYVATREAFRRSLPGKVTPTWVMANVAGYKAEGSAKALLRYLTSLALIDGDGQPTEVARKWRLDDSYGEACDLMLRAGFPIDIVEAVPDGSASEVLVNLFMARGMGEGSSKNLARIYRLIASKVPPEPKKPRSLDSEGRAPRARGEQRDLPAPDKATTSQSKETPAPHHEHPEREILVLRYFLERGRLAEVRIPSDLDEREKKRLFAHLKIDLLDEVSN